MTAQVIPFRKPPLPANEYELAVRELVAGLGLVDGFLSSFREKYGFVAPPVPALAVRWAEDTAAFLLFRVVAVVNPEAGELLPQILERMQRAEADAEAAGRRTRLS
jgi:hypothetical protein